MAEGWQLNSARMEIEERRRYLYVRIQGELATPAEVERAIVVVRDRMATGTKKLLVDVRGLRVPLADAACQTAWQFIHGKEYAMLACALPEDVADLLGTRMNMTGLSASLPFRAFANIVDAHRWLEVRPSGIHRRSTMGMPAVNPNGHSTNPEFPPEPEAEPVVNVSSSMRPPKKTPSVPPGR